MARGQEASADKPHNSEFEADTYSSSVIPTEEHTIAVDMYDPFLPFGTKVVMNGLEYVVEDTVPLTWYGMTFDVYYDDHDVSEAHGHQLWEAFLADDNGDREDEITQTTTKRIFSVDLDSTSLSDVIAAYDLTAIQRARYEVLLSTNGNYFYVIIDRDDNGKENVHFLNQVDEEDLLRLMDEEEADAIREQLAAQKATPTPEPTVIVKQPTETPELIEKKPASMLPLLAPLLIVLGGGGGFAFYQYL